MTGGEIDDEVMFDGDGMDPFDPYIEAIDIDPEPPPPDPEFPEPEPEAGYIGEPPWAAMQHWHPQGASHSCAVASQEFILDDLTGIDHSEAELAAVAEANGWYVPGQGTRFDDVGKVLEHYGIPTEQHHGVSVDQLATALAEGDRVMVAVDSSELMFPGGYDPQDPLDHYPGIPGQGADHVVQVIGIDNTDPSNPMVVLNDPGRPDGQGGMISLAEFAEAWEDSGNFMVTARAA